MQAHSILYLPFCFEAFAFCPCAWKTRAANPLFHHKLIKHHSDSSTLLALSPQLNVSICLFYAQTILWCYSVYRSLLWDFSHLCLIWWLVKLFLNQKLWTNMNGCLVPLKERLFNGFRDRWWTKRWEKKIFELWWSHNTDSLKRRCFPCVKSCYKLKHHRRFFFRWSVSVSVECHSVFLYRFWQKAWKGQQTAVFLMWY